jgi:magnesium-transporting ATPase (P-type)
VHLAVAVQVAALFMLTRQPWYTRFDPRPPGTNCFDRHQSNSSQCSMSYENSTVFLTSLAQFLITALVFNKGPPFRRPIYTNIWLLLGEAASCLLLLLLLRALACCLLRCAAASPPPPSATLIINCPCPLAVQRCRCKRCSWLCSSWRPPDRSASGLRA